MSPEILVLIVIAIFITLILLELPVGLSIAISGTLGVFLLSGTQVASRMLATTPYSGTAKYALIVIPMYILLGMLVANSGIGADIYRAVNRGASRLPGGLAAAAAIATALFSGISGSSAADVATFGRIAVNAMTRHGYDRLYAAAVVAAAGAFAALIPPSVALVIYAIIAEQHVAGMVIAGIIPGMLSAAVLVLFVVGRAFFGGEAVGGWRVHRELAQSIAAEVKASRAPAVLTDRPAGGGNPAVTTNQSNRDDALAILYTLIIFGIVIGGLYGGIFTVTESASVGAFAALVIALIARRHKGISIRDLIVPSLRETASVTSMIFLLLVGGAIFSFFVAFSGVPRSITEWATSLTVPPEVIVVIFLLVLLVLGMVLDGLSTMLLTVPLVAPVVDGLGFEGIWFGVLVLKTIEIGLITPPVGINTFIIAGIAKVPVWGVFRHLVPFVLLDIAVTAVLFAFPDIILWLPRAAGLVP